MSNKKKHLSFQKDKNKIITCDVQLNNQTIQRIKRTGEELMNTTVSQIRQLLELPPNISAYFYFREKGSKLTSEINIEDEDKHFAADLQFQVTKYSKEGKKFKANFINVYVKPFPIAPSYSSALEYSDKMIEHYEIEDFIDRLKPLQLTRALFIFLDDLLQSKIKKRLEISMDGEKKINESSVVKIEIPYHKTQFMKNPQRTDFYHAYGKVSNITFLKNGRLNVKVDIGVLSAKDFRTPQQLPDGEFADYLNYAIIEETVNIEDARQTLYKFSNRDKKGKIIQDITKIEAQNPIHEMIFSGQAIDSKIYDPLKPIDLPELPTTLNESQIEAVNMVLNQSLSIIQGPPGTGKTLVISASVSLLLKADDRDSSKKILVCAPSNTAADFLADRIFPLLDGQMVRYYPIKREDLFNVKQETLKRHSLLAAVLADCQNALDKSHPEKEDLPYFRQIPQDFEEVECSFDDPPHEEEEVKLQLSDFKTISTESEIQSEQDKSEMKPNKEEEQNGKAQEEEENSKFTDADKRAFLRYFKRGICNLEQNEFKHFMAVKDWIVKQILKKVPVVITTCKATKGILLKKLQFDTVIIDEATQAHEIETLETIFHAKKVVLVGDQNQLGPVFRGSTPILDQMLSRLKSAGFTNFVMLKQQYRMHPDLLKIPNTLFYKDQIQSCYKSDSRSLFMNEIPMLFINCDEQEEKFSNSFFNKGEVNIVAGLLQHLKQVCKFDIQKFGFVAPYQSQVRQLKIEMQSFGIEENVMTVDSWQGREKPFMIMSTVRSNNDRQLGFLNSPRRLNVALTRAQHGLIIVGNKNTLSSDNNWMTLINHFVVSQRYCQDLKEAIKMIEQQRK